MTRPDYTNIANGSSSWDATVNDNLDILRDSFPFPDYADLATLSSARPPAQNEGCAAAVISPSWTPYWCDGTSWVPWPATLAAHAATHQDGGSDEIATATPAPNAIPKADGAGSLDAWVTHTPPYTHPNHTGDVTSVGDGVQTIANDAVTNAKAADMAANTVKARAAGTSGDPQDLAMAASTILARLASGNLKAATPTEVTALLNVFTSGLKGLVPASGGGTTNFLRADGTFAAPAVVFGSNYHRQSTPGPLTTTSGTLVTLSTYAPTGGPFTGTYRLGFRVEFNSDTPPNDAEVELRRTDGGAVQLAFNEEEPLDGDDWNTLSFFSAFVLAGASPTFDVRARTAGGAGTISIRKIEWEWWRVL